MSEIPKNNYAEREAFMRQFIEELPVEFRKLLGNTVYGYGIQVFDQQKRNEQAKILTTSYPKATIPHGQREMLQRSIPEVVIIDDDALALLEWWKSTLTSGIRVRHFLSHQYKHPDDEKNTFDRYVNEGLAEIITPSTNRTNIQAVIVKPFDDPGYHQVIQFFIDDVRKLNPAARILEVSDNRNSVSYNGSDMLINSSQVIELQKKIKDSDTNPLATIFTFLRN